MPCSGGALNPVGMPYSRLTTKWSKPDNTVLSISRTAITIGNTLKGLLVSSLHLLFKPADQWSDRQKQMVVMLFGEYPDLKTAYGLCLSLQVIFVQNTVKNAERLSMARW